MLKYQFNINSVKEDLQQVDISSFEITEIPFVGDGKMMLTCYLNERNLVHENDTIVVVHDVIVPGNSHKSSTINEYKIESVNENNLSFAIIYDKYVDLDASFARTETYRQYSPDGTVEDIEYIVVFFKTYHNFRNENNENITVYLSDDVTTASNQFIKMRGQVVDNRTLRFPKKDNITAYNRLFYTDIEIERNYASMSYFKLLQENFVFKLDMDGNLPNTTFYLQKVLSTISLPLTNTFSTELFNSINVDGFVKQQIEMSLNKSAENEKDIYYPVGSNGDIIRRIKFNFHFRERDVNGVDNDWAVNKDLSWNGVEKNPNYSSTIDGSKKTKLPTEFFSYNVEENQSDLLAYLGFTDGDVKFRRNVLKKSFIRLLFYDSTDVFKQKLIAYSTVFFDTGALLNRYMRNIEQDVLGCGYIIYSKDVSAGEVSTANGIRVNRELDVKTRINEDKIEECRLSSQMVVSDKFISSNSSEGFYLYLWKDNVSEGVPIDIYMRIEFNHAKYGRIIPFMMPYSDGHIKTFREIAEDCTEIEDEELINIGYTLEEYRKFSYIHFKYTKDDELGYIYYLDPDTYGSNAGVDGDSLILNLYEANVV